MTSKIRLRGLYELLVHAQAAQARIVSVCSDCFLLSQYKAALHTLFPLFPSDHCSTFAKCDTEEVESEIFPRSPVPTPRVSNLGVCWLQCDTAATLSVGISTLRRKMAFQQYTKRHPTGHANAYQNTPSFSCPSLQSRHKSPRNNSRLGLKMCANFELSSFKIRNSAP